MFKKLGRSIFLILFLMLFSCNKEKLDKSGVVFTFDDNYISEWLSAKELFRKYNVKATFFISSPQKLSIEEINILKNLEEDGHEIASHSMNHVNLPDFLLNHTMNEYIDQEIKPANKILDSLGFNIRAYAYPFGKSTVESDKLLLNYFKVLRKATYNIENVTLDKIDRTFTKIGSNRVVDAMGIDNQYGITLENLEMGMKRARLQNEVLVLHAHKIVENGTGYTISQEYLEEAFKLCQKYNLKSLTISELVR